MDFQFSWAVTHFLDGEASIRRHLAHIFLVTNVVSMLVQLFVTSPGMKRLGVTAALLVLPLSAALILLAPEVVRVALGPRWGMAVAPFQILGIGMLFRTSYKMSDSIARSTGAVYRRAWRQIIYAVLVVIGAWIGQRWGIVGVAWGALGALTANFVIMAALSLDVARIGWSDFWRAHLPAVLLTLASFPPVWLVARSARALHLPALAVLVLAGGTLLLACGALVWGAPSRFLGRDGQWMVRTMREFVGGSARRPRARRPIPQEAP
jgi:PST family polysaccharide transporter